MSPVIKCTATGFKSFLVFCNVVLLFIGAAVFILGLKMEWALSVLHLISIPIIMKTVKAVIAAGFFISLTGVTGICGACYELVWLLIVHLAFLGFIVLMEFSLGVTLMVVKQSIEKSLESSECNNMCVAALDAAILEYALPSAGLMVAVIFLEALMVYSAGRLYYYIRNGGKTSTTPVDDQNVQMDTVSAPPPTYVAPPTYDLAAAAPASQPLYVPSPEPMYAAAPQPMYRPQVNSYNTNANFWK